MIYRIFKIGCFSLLLLVFVVVVTLPLNFDLVKLALTQRFSPICVSPDSFPSNMGDLYEFDVRDAGNVGGFTAFEPTDWVESEKKTLHQLRSMPRDVVVYVHGFQTSLKAATCVSENLRADLADLGRFKNKRSPDVVVFGWPGAVGPTRFSSAQMNATHAANYLAELLSALGDRRTVLIAHSLGAQVAMEAIASMKKKYAVRPLRAIVLIQGAIQATSVRKWTREFTQRYPAAEVWSARTGSSTISPYSEKSTDIGCYVHAAESAQHLIVTTSKNDTTLDRMFTLDEFWKPSKCSQLKVLPDMPRIRHLPQVRAIGLHARSEVRFVYRTLESEIDGDPLDNSQEEIDYYDDVIIPPDHKVQTEITDVYRFEIPHDSYHEIRLEELVGFRLFFDWHSPLSESALRKAVVERIWNILEPIPVK